MIYPFDKSRFRDIIIIQSNIKDYNELVNRILAKLDPSVVDPRVRLFLAGKYREAGVSTFFKDIFK